MEEKHVNFTEKGIRFKGFDDMASFLSFVLEHVYGWKSENPVFQRILEETRKFQEGEVLSRVDDAPEGQASNDSARERLRSLLEQIEERKVERQW